MPATINLADLGRRVRASRLSRRLTLEEVVTRTGFTVSWLSKLENGQLTPSLDGLVRLAQALECGVDDLVEGLSVAPQFVVVKRGAGLVSGGRNGNGRNGRGIIVEGLADQWRDRRMHPAILHVSGTGNTAQPECREGERFLLVLHGEIKLIYGDERILLGPGDSIYLDAAIPHGMAANGRGTARVLSVWHDSGTNGPRTATKRSRQSSRTAR